MRPPLIVLQPSNGGLALVRTLGRRGIDVEVLATEGDWYTARTRYASKRTVLPKFAEDDGPWVEVLADRARRGSAAVIAGSDEATEFLSRRRDELPGELVTWERSSEVHLPLMDKVSSYAMCEAAGVRAPWTRFVGSREDLESVAADAPYPCVMKPVLTHLWRPIFGPDRVLLAHGPDELRAHGERALGAGLDTIVSEYIPGGDDHVEEAILVRSADGEFPMEYGCRKLRQSPAGFGAASLCEAAPLEESLELARALLAHADFVGVAGIETKRHAETGEYFFIEANVRLPTQFGLGDACGADASWRTYATLAELPLGPRPTPKMGTRLLFPELEFYELRRFWQGQRNGAAPKSWRGFARGYRRLKDVGVLDVRDPGPGLAIARYAVEKRVRRVLGKPAAA